MNFTGLLLSCLLLAPAGEDSPFLSFVGYAEEALASGDFDRARRMIDRAAERDPKSVKVWELRARWAEAARDRDELVFALHRQLRLALAQKAPRKQIASIRAKLEAVDAIAPDLLDLKLHFVEKLIPIARACEKAGRPHSAIRIHNEIVALDPERTESEEAVQRIASRPDPSLAESARPKDLLADVSYDWIEKFDDQHADWENRARHVGENYTTLTDAGYEVMIRAAEAMERVNAFYRIFFNFATPDGGGSVPHIDLKIFRNKEEYLKKGSNPPEWSGGLFTGSAVETYVGTGGFDEMVRTLFHEVGHQFVSLAAPGASSTTWLNEGMATYFEGTQVLANGSVRFNLPANHYLFQLSGRLEAGLMKDLSDGVDPKDPEVIPEKAPTLEMIVGSRYPWGPAWYAPVWGVTYFFFNYMDPVDGRFVYRDKFRQFIDKAGGRTGDTAVRKLEEFVLADPARPTKGVDFSKAAEPLPLPRTFKELSAVWTDWIIRLRDEESGRIEMERPYHEWARHAVTRGDQDQALEHFEKGLAETPDSAELLIEFAQFLGDKLKNTDRASRLVLQAARILEFQKEVDEAALKKADRLLAKYDPKWRDLLSIHEELWSSARSLARRYLDEDLPLMAMDVAWRFSTELGVPEIRPYFEEAVRRSGKSLWLWKLAYNERNLRGWVSQGKDIFIPEGPVLRAHFGDYKEEDFNYQFLTMDTVTSGDFSMEADVYAEAGKVSFCGLVFGKKGSQSCNAVVIYPGGTDRRYTGRFERSGFVDLTSFYGPGVFKIWRHNTLKASFPDWHTLRVDVSGKMVDIWFNGRLVVTHEFPNLGVVRGGFGLITGVGEARFRNIRYISRPSADFGARIEREILMERLREKSMSEGGGGSLNGSWLGQAPPLPDGVKWLKDQRTCWEEKGPMPTLIVFFSIEQNEEIPIHKWLEHLWEKYSDVGLQIVSIASAYDEEDIEAYLERHAFPGSVCVDRFPKKGYGELFELYGIQHYNMPRVVLLDVDHTVYWEGDPGFRIGSTWRPGMGSYLDDPLKELISRRKLKALVQWHKEWTETGRDALKEGRLEHCVRLLLETRAFEGSTVPEVIEAQGVLQQLVEALDALEATVLAFNRSEGDPALDTLLQWGRLVEKRNGSRALKASHAVLDDSRLDAWTRALALVKRTMRESKSNGESQAVESLIRELDALEGLFPEILRDRISESAASGDAAQVGEILRDAENIPAQWLAREFFKW